MVAALRDSEVTTVFGIPASYTIEIYDALARNGDGIRSVVARNEQAATYMADGYARRSGKPGVVIVTGGPGLGNTVTGLQTAYGDSSPVVVIASDHDPAQRTGHPLGLPHEAADQETLARSTGAITVRADDPGSVREAVRDTLAATRRGRPRPGVVLVSRNALEAPEVPSGTPPDNPVQPPLPTFGRHEVTEVIRLLHSSADPIVIAGAGVVQGGSEAQLASFLKLAGLPVVTTVAGSSAIDRDIGWFGVLDNPASRKLVERADLVLALGTSFGSASTAGWSLRINGSLIQVDIDPHSLNQHYRASLAIEADLGTILTSLTDRMVENPEYLLRHPPPPAPAHVSHPWIDPLEAALPPRGVTISCDVTMATRWIPGAVSLGPERRFMTPWNFQTLGWSYAAALGVQAAAPDDTVLAVMGDGGALFTIGELATAVEHQLPVCLLVFNNRSYGIIAEVQDRFCAGRRFGVDLHQPDFVAAARAFGLPASRADTPEGLERSLRRHLGTGAPSLIEARVGLSDLGVGSDS